MESLKFYKVKDQYVNYLKAVDNRVQNNKAQRRPYVGVVLSVGKYRYFVPMESPKPNHKNIKGGYHIMKLDEGRLGILGFNNMIPVCEDSLIKFNIDNERDEKYSRLLKEQLNFINRNKKSVYDHASKTYYSRVNNKSEFLRKICCDFKELERACDKYNVRQ